VSLRRDCSIDGERRPVEQAISATDRGLLYGDGVSEYLRAIDGEPFLWDSHRERLRVSCEALGLAIPADLRERVVTTLTANDLSEALVRIVITRRNGSADDASGSTPSKEPEQTVLITTEPAAPLTEAETAPATLQTVKTKPIPDDSVPTRANTLCRLDRVLARRELIEEADEALLLTREGTVAGCAGSALVLVVEDAVRIPPTSGQERPRPMRTIALDLAREEGLPVATGELVPDDVRGAQEAFLASARWGVRPVAQVDGIEIGAGPVTALLRGLLADRVET
jgi:branched-chain amino acid aminotransferase